MKKLFTFLFALVAVAASASNPSERKFPTVTAAKAMVLEVGKVKAKTSDAEVQVPIKATKNDGFGSGIITIEWDKDKLELTGVDYSSLAPNNQSAPVSNKGTYKIAFGDDYATPDGTCIRDYVHVTDLADAHLRAIESSATGAVNLGTGHGYSVKEIVESARRVTGHPVPAEVTPRRPGDPDKLVAKVGLAEKVLGWKASFTEIDAIVESAWKWHVKHPNGYGAECGGAPAREKHAQRDFCLWNDLEISADGMWIVAASDARLRGCLCAGNRGARPPRLR